MTCSKYGMRNHNSRGCGKYSNQGKHSKQAVEKDPVEENIKLIPPTKLKKISIFLTLCTLVAAQFLTFG